jgi:hypothetical protein
MKAVRMGASERVREDMQEWTFDEVVKEHPLHHQVEELVSAAKESYAKADKAESATKRGELDPASHMLLTAGLDRIGADDM